MDHRSGRAEVGRTGLVHTLGVINGMDLRCEINDDIKLSMLGAMSDDISS